MYNTGHSGQILIKFEYCWEISNIIQISKFMKMHEVVAELLNVDGRAVRYDEANSYYPELCEWA